MRENQSLFSLWGVPSKSPSEISDIRFSCISNFLSMSSEDSADVGMDSNSLPPRFRRFSFLLNGKHSVSDLKSAVPRHQSAFSHINTLWKLYYVYMLDSFHCLNYS
jgi:hypothetical protein